MGSLAIYADVLQTYCSSTDRKLAALPELLERDFDRFVIEVHGLKGAAFAVSAYSAANLAQSLEDAGKRKEMHAVRAAFPVFQERMERSLVEAREFVGAFQAERGERAAPAQRASVLTVQSLEALELAFMNFDTEWLTKFFREHAAEFDGEAGILVAALRKHFEAYEFEQPLALLAAYRQEHLALEETG